MLRFYLTTLRMAVGPFNQAWQDLAFWVAALVAVLTLPGLGTPQWVPVAVAGLAAAYAFLRVNYRRYAREVTRRRSLEDTRKRQRVLDQVEALRSEGVQIYARELAGGTDVEVGGRLLEWVVDLHVWRGRTSDCLRSAFPAAVQSRFDNLGPIPSRSFDHAVTGDHARHLQVLAEQLDRLSELVGTGIANG